MATASQMFRHSRFLKEARHFRRYTTTSNQRLRKPLDYIYSNRLVAAVAAAGVGCAVYQLTRNRWQKVEAASSENSQPKVVKKLTPREERFAAFASLTYNDQNYMTPQDFLESVTQDQPRIRKHRSHLNDRDVTQMLKATPSRNGWTSSNSKRLFRDMSDKGMISYTEYLFLLCVLTKPKCGFQIAFNMFDTDMNDRVDKKEFLVMERVMQDTRQERDAKAEGRDVSGSPAGSSSSSSYGDWWVPKLINRLLSGSSPVGEQSPRTVDTPKSAEPESQPDAVAEIQVDEKVQDTTLLTYFFGKKGADKLTFKDFAKFMDNLQTEVLDLEFTEYSKGLRTISESEFGRILLKYTKLHKDEHEVFIQRIQDKIVKEEGISFEEFRKFFLFLNNLEDFTLAMNLYTIAGQPISQEEFQRACQACVGYTLHPHLVETVFLIFDADGDGHLSHHEFICIMKDRVHRGLTANRYNASNKWEAYKYCVKDVMREQASLGYNLEHFEP